MVDDRRQLLTRLTALLGPEGLLSDPAARRVYAQDSSHLTLGRPWVVALPETPDQVARIVAMCAAAGVSVVCRGSGTGLSGGAVPNEGALVLGTARLNQARAVSSSGRTITVQAGVLNEQVSNLALADNLHFAPDPSSQAITTIGGNIAENSGGPHCLRYGVTLQHLRKLQWVDARGRSWSTGSGVPVERGFDLVSLLCGSEGTLGVVTGADLKLVPNAETAVTLLAFFPDLHDATRSVVDLLTSGLMPVAVEMVDQAMLLAVEEAFAFGFPTDVQGAMIVEFTGSFQEVSEDVQRAVAILQAGGSRAVQQASDPAERLELWKCRKKAFGAVGRLAPRYVTMDVVVPLGRLPELVLRIQEIKARHGVDIATAFHAGDGNLHPGVHYDDRVPGETERAHQAADEIIRAALQMDGSSTGEHGVGIEKLHVLPLQIDAVTLELSRGIKNIFDPDNLLNPGKLLPSTEAVCAPCKPLPTEPVFRWDSMSVTAPANTPLALIQEQVLERGLCLPVGIFRSATEGTLGLGSATNIGDLVAQLTPGPAVLAMGTARDFLLELWAHTGDGRLFHTGAPVFKNVAGFGLGQALCGSGRHYVEPLAATFQLRPLCESVLAMNFVFEPGAPETAHCLERLFQCVPKDDISSPVAILDRDPGRLSLLLGGRNRDWGLGATATRIKNILTGFSRERHEYLKPGEMADFLGSDFLPQWARASADWAMLFPPPIQFPGSPTLPPGNRLIWQGVPNLWWTPDSLAAGENWHRDQLFSQGRVTPIPSADPSTAESLLAELKDLFDPKGNLNDN
jgi:glycolate dehydrogenase FAD-linked subunit